MNDLPDLPDLHDPLTRRQWDLEAEMQDLGSAEYVRRSDKARKQGRVNETAGGSVLIKIFVRPLAASIQAVMDRASSGAPGRRHLAVRLIKDMRTEVVAYLTVSTVLNLVGYGSKRRNSIQSVARWVGRAIEDESRVEAFAKREPALLRHAMKQLDAATSHARHRRLCIAHLIDKRGDAWKPLNEGELLQVGMLLIELLIQKTGMVETHTIRLKRKKSDLTRLALTDEASALVEKEDAAAALLMPRFLPMIVPPRPWEGMKGGGYISNGLARLPLITGTRRRVPRPGPAVLRALNAVQATPWRINKPVLEALGHAWNNNIEIGIPSRDLRPTPNKPLDIDTNEIARKAYRREARSVHGHNAATKSTRFRIGRTLSIAEKFAEYDAIYFPHQLDFRGRMYAVSQYLTPQGPDNAKALIEFSISRPLSDPAAVEWFTIHGANTFGFDKVSFEDRIAWVTEHEEDILRTAADPYAHLWWADADKPWCFLAWCFEWAAWRRDPDGFLSRLPVALDGSCNGLQHYSALLRDPVGGAAVNLVPRDTPADIYQVVADAVTRTLAADDSLTAQKWLQIGIDRSITKRPVMVLPYGGTSMACLNYVREAYRDKVAGGTHDPFEVHERSAATLYLSGVVWGSIGDVVVSARLAMDWLRTAASIAAKVGVNIKWTTPSGFNAVQDYRCLRRRRIKTRLNGSIILPTITEETDAIDPKKQANGLPPNFVHSLDASALVATVNRALDAGITDFAMIHDSYGTHAAHTAALAMHIREAFVSMYEGSDPLAALEHTLRSSLPPEAAERLPPLPSRGSLDLSGVLQSKFFFA